MNKQTKIIATEARVPLQNLILSKMNPRQNVSEQDIIDLAASIWDAGLIQSIAGLTGKNQIVEIVAGGRRLRALQYLAKKHPNLAHTHPMLANPMVTLAPDAKTAEKWATLENVARHALHPAEEIRAYGKMRTAGHSPAQISCAFTVTEKHVYRRLALAALPEKIIDALATDKINLNMATCFTICDDEEHSLLVLQQILEGDHHVRAITDVTLKKLLKPASVKGTDRRAIFVGKEAYKKAGGNLTSDLFNDESLFDNPEILDGCLRVALEEAAQVVAETEGWKWVDIVESSYFNAYDISGVGNYEPVYRVEGKLSEDQQERYNKLDDYNYDFDGENEEIELETLKNILDGEYTSEQKTHAGAFVLVDYSGKLIFRRGWIKPEDQEAAIECGVLAKSFHKKANPSKSKSVFSQVLAQDLARIKTGARQHAAFSDPEMLLALLAFQLSGKFSYKRPIGLQTNTVINTPTTENSGYIIDQRLTSTPTTLPDKDIVKTFCEFKAQGSERILIELTNQLAPLLDVVDIKLCSVIDEVLKTNIREVWVPTAKNFFTRVNGDYLNRLWCKFLDITDDDPKAAAFKKLKKAVKATKLEDLFNDKAVQKAHKLTDKQIALINSWFPKIN